MSPTGIVVGPSATSPEAVVAAVASEVVAEPLSLPPPDSLEPQANTPVTSSTAVAAAATRRMRMELVDVCCTVVPSGSIGGAGGRDQGRVL